MSKPYKHEFILFTSEGCIVKCVYHLALSQQTIRLPHLQRLPAEQHFINHVGQSRCKKRNVFGDYLTHLFFKE